MVIQLATCSEKQAAFFHVATLTCLDRAEGGGGKALNLLQLSTAFEGEAQAAESQAAEPGLREGWGGRGVQGLE